MLQLLQLDYQSTINCIKNEIQSDITKLCDQTGMSFFAGMGYYGIITGIRYPHQNDCLSLDYNNLKNLDFKSYLLDKNIFHSEEILIRNKKLKYLYKNWLPFLKLVNEIQTEINQPFLISLIENDYRNQNILVEDFYIRD